MTYCGRLILLVVSGAIGHTNTEPGMQRTDDNIVSARIGRGRCPAPSRRRVWVRAHETRIRFFNLADALRAAKLQHGDGGGSSES